MEAAGIGPMSFVQRRIRADLKCQPHLQKALCLAKRIRLATAYLK